MQCKKGIYIKKQEAWVPCGQCLPCRINKGRLWSARILMEQKYHPDYSYFLTFTYSEDDCPITIGEDGTYEHTLKKKKFLKWLNNTAQRISPFRYYAVGEYGDDTFRPHYHVAIFPSDSSKVGEILAAWRKGFTSCAELNSARARYLANYTAKKLTKDSDERLKCGQEPEFRTSSRNPALGATCVDALCDHYARPQGQKLLKARGDVERTIRFDGRIYPLGSWALTRMRNRLGIPVLHRDRIAANPNYLNIFETEEAEWYEDDTISEVYEENISSKLKQGYHRGKGQKI